MNTNILVLDLDVKKNAEYYSDRDLTQKIPQYCQMLADGQHRLGITIPGLNCSFDYESKEVSWIISSLGNYKWFRNALKSLMDEYFLRYYKHHYYQPMLDNCHLDIPEVLFQSKGLKPFIMSIDDKYVNEGNVVESFRNYYVNECLGFATYKNRVVPRWLVAES